jgi:hypothetical protein
VFPPENLSGTVSPPHRPSSIHVLRFKAPPLNRGTSANQQQYRLANRQQGATMPLILLYNTTQALFCQEIFHKKSAIQSALSPLKQDNFTIKITKSLQSFFYKRYFLNPKYLMVNYIYGILFKQCSETSIFVHFFIGKI